MRERTYGAIECAVPASGGRHATWRVTEIEPHVAIRLKQMFPRIAKTARPPYLLTGGPLLDADLRWFLSRYPMRISPEDEGLMQERKLLFDVGQAELTSILSPNWRPPAAIGFREGQSPYAYQMQAAELVRRTKRLLLVDELGLGKTVSAIASILDTEYLPALIVPQTHLPDQWAEKVAEFTDLRTHIIKKTTPYELPPADVYICPYSKLHGWIDYADKCGFKSVVFDEIQELRSGTSTAKGQAAKAFAMQAQLTLGTSGTPIYNYGEEIFRVCSFLEDGCLGTWEDFTREWCGPGPGGKWVVTDPAALGTYLRENHLMLRRTRSDVGHERKFPNVIVHGIDVDEEVLDNEADTLARLAQQVIKGSFVERGQASREFDMMLRHATGVAKARHVAAFVKILLEAGEPVLLAGWHRDVYEIWMRELAPWHPVLYTGTESAKQKDRAKKAFISGVSRVMIMSNRSGAGLDGLQKACRIAVIGELDWSPKVHEQFIGRLDRPGQEHQVDAIYLVSEGGSDPAVMGVLGLKSSQSAGIVDPLSAPTPQQSDATRIQQLAEAFLASGPRVRSAPTPRPVEPEPVEQGQLL